MKLAMIGTGYVGLTSGALFADRGNNVVCVDKNPEVLNELSKGKVHFYEPGLAEIVQRTCARGNLSFSDDLESAVRDAKVTFIAVGTPSGNDGAFNLNYVASAAREIGKALRDLDGLRVVVGKSTVPQRTHELISDSIDEGLAGSKTNWAYVSNPETLAEGSAVRDFSKPDRILIGTDSNEAFDTMCELYHPFIKKEGGIIRGSSADAELGKLGANAILASRVAIINEIARIADNTPGADMEVIRRMISSDKRIGLEFCYPGPGYGGSCFPKDVKGVVAKSREEGYLPRILSKVFGSNEDHKKYLADKAIRLLKEDVNPVVGVWGVTFKPGTDDMREAPALTILPKLIEAGANIKIYDPQDSKAREEFSPYSKNVRFVNSQYEASNDADALMLLTEWPQFDTPDYDILEKCMNGRKLFDYRNRWNSEVANRNGFSYFGVGRNFPLN